MPEPFIELTAVAVKNSQALVRGVGANPTEIRDLMSYAEAFGPCADELEAFAHFLRHSVNAAKNQAGSNALTPTPWPSAWPNARKPPISPRTSTTCAAPLGVTRRSAKRWSQGSVRTRRGNRISA